jgi:hypothetical protein
LLGRNAIGLHERGILDLIVKLLHDRKHLAMQGHVLGEVHESVATMGYVAATALYLAHYNFCRVHGSLKGTPAMKAGIAGHPWTLTELIDNAGL